MAVANLAARDPRLAGVFLESQPAGPRLALAAAIAARTANPVARTVMRWLSELINLWYGQDVLGAGDLLRLPPPAHRPLVVMTIGTADHYGFAATRALFQAVWGGGDEQVIHQGVSGTWTWSGEHPLLLVCDGADHYSDSLGYPDVLRAFDELLRAACTRAPGRDGPLTPGS